MRLRMTDSRKQRFQDLQEALDEKTKSKALDKAAKYTVRMRGGTTAVPKGAIAELMQLAEEQGSVTVAEIADVLDTPEVTVEYKSRWTVGELSPRLLSECQGNL